MSARKFCTRIHAYDSTGRKVCPYTGVRGKKTGLYSVNFTTDNKKFEGRSEIQLIADIESGRFRERGSIRMKPLGPGASNGNSAFAPLFLDGKPIPKRH